MSRTKKIYSNGQPRTSSNASPRKSPIKRYSGSRKAEKASLDRQVGGADES